jgi:hypothetical protein
MSPALRVAVWDELLLDRFHDRGVPLELHSWELRRDGGVRDILVLDKLPRGLVDLVIPFKQDTAPVCEIECVQFRAGAGITFDLGDHGLGHRIPCELSSLDFLTCDQTKKYVRALQVPCRPEHDEGVQRETMLFIGAGLLWASQ